MKHTLFYYSGTGNSLWITKELSSKLGETNIISMVEWQKNKQPISSDVIGFIFPVYMWGVPGRVLEFISQITFLESKYVFAIAVNAGEVSNTIVQLKKIIQQKNSRLSLGFQIKMPSNYIPWGGPRPKDRIQKLYDDALAKIDKISNHIKAKETRPLDVGPLWQRILYSMVVYRLSFSHVRTMDGKFWVDDKCNGCGICAKVCPTKNVVLVNNRPTWHKNCEQCLACIQWCPQCAIQYGKNTVSFERYHHPEVSLKEMLKRD